MFRKIFITLVLICLPGALLEAAEFMGRVLDQEGHPIAGVNIQTDISGLKAVTDHEGFFRLEAKDTHPTSLTFSHISYQPALVRIRESVNPADIKVVMTAAVYPGQNIRVTALRARRGVTPAAFSDFSEDEIARDYTLSDLPVLLETTPNMYAVSYTGGIAGASDFKIRGFSYKQLGVYINGIPLNDPEDRFTYFYDLPDFPADAADIQVQRGVGNSLYGDATFGGSINIASAGLERPREVSFVTGYGSFTAANNRIADMRKTAVEYSSGLIDGRWSLAARYSKMYSGGYRQNAWYDGWAYFLSLSRLDENMTTIVNVYGGPMQAALAFNGIDRETMKSNRRYNPSTYENEIDDFNQPHYELHNNIRLNDKLTLLNTLYYIRGKGFYEQYKADGNIVEYNIGPADLVDPAQTDIDLVRQKWVTKNQYGWNPRLEIAHHKGELTLGGAFYYFNSDHWGQVIWAENVNAEALGPRHRFYNYFGTKYSGSLYALESYALTERLRLMGNLQLRYLTYDFDQVRMGYLPGYQYDVNWLFFSPRAGLNYKLSETISLFVSAAVASREPEDVSIYDAEEITAFPNLEIKEIRVNGDNDTTFTFGDPTVHPERVYNFELGANYRDNRYHAGLNFYWMEFRNEIVPEGGLNDNGQPKIGNAERSVHAGIEFEGGVAAFRNFQISGNAAYNYNRLKDYTVYPDYDYDGAADDTLDYSGNITAGFPDYLGNLIFDYNTGRYRLTYRLRVIGKQYVDNGQTEALAIDPYTVSSLSAQVSLGDLDGVGKFTLSGRIDNLFNKKYETSGYSYWWGPEPFAEYYVGAERSFYLQLRWDLK